MGRKWANICQKLPKMVLTFKVYIKFGVEIYVAAKKGEPDPGECCFEIRYRPLARKCQNT